MKNTMLCKHTREKYLISAIEHQRYVTSNDMVKCTITMCNGYTVVGKSKPYSHMFIEQVSQVQAYRDCLRQLFVLESRELDAMCDECMVCSTYSQ